MLQTNMPRAEGYPAPASIREPQAGGINDLIDSALAFLRRQCVVICLAALVGSGLGMLYLSLTPPVYTAQLQLLVDGPKTQFSQDQSILAATAFDASQFETQVQLLKSRGLAVKIIKQLKLSEDPDFNGSRSALILSRLRALVSHSSPEARTEAVGEPQDGMIAAFQSRLSAARIGYSNLIEISYSASSPIRAAEVANAVAEAYVADQVGLRLAASRKARDWMQERLRDLDQQALAAERAVSAYKSQNNIVTYGGKPIDEQHIAGLYAGLVTARAQTSDAFAKLSRYKAILNANPGAASSIGNLDAAGVEALSSPIINNLRGQYLELERRLAEWTPRFGRNHSAVVDLQNRMRDLRGSILDEVKRYAETSQSEFEIAKQRQQDLEKRLSDAVAQSQSTNLAEITIRGLENKAKSLRALHDNFNERYMGSVQQETFPLSEAQVVYPAVPPQKKSKPKGTMIIALGTIGGLALGLGLGLLREIRDRAFYTPTQIERLLGLPCLSLVPRLQLGRLPSARSKAQTIEQDTELRRISTGSISHRAIIDRPSSRFAETIRSLKFAIDVNPAKAPNQIIGITSALPNEGKTTIAASLGQIITHSGKRVIVVDCDLRNASLSANLAPTATAGIVDVVNCNRPTEETIWRDPKTELAFLPALSNTPAPHTNELLAANSMRLLFDQLRAKYDYIIVDLPPLTPLVDVRSTTTFIDFFILVVEWGETPIDAVRHALHTAPNVSESLLGVVLNKANIKAMPRYDAHCGSYYNDENYRRYGLTTTSG